MEILTPAGARWSCMHTGECCRRFELGPVEPEIAAGLTAHEAADGWPEAGTWRKERRLGGQVATFFRFVGDGCVFLGDGRCEVHSRLGAAAKPAFCRLFPFAVVEEPRGLAVVVRPECGGLHESFATGQLVSEQAAAAAALPEPGQRRRFAPDRVEVFPGVWRPTSAWLPVEDRLRARVLAGPRGPQAHVAQLRDELAAWVDAELPTPDPAVFDRAARAALEGLHILLSHVLAQGGPAHRVAQVAAVHADVARARDGRVPRRVPLSPEAREYAGLLLRSALLAKDVHILGSVAAGLGAWLLGLVLAQAALADAGEPLTPAALASVHGPWSRLQVHPMIQDLLRRARPALVDMTLHA